MSKKKKKNNVVQMLSPEGFIRKRSRNLPLYKCWIGSSWKEMGKSSVMVSRKHANGNISFCFYLVDLYCLGVKDTFFNFNVDETELVERLESQNQADPFVEIPYALAHNIIYAAVEFADDYEFQPHKEFTRTTQFFLEEDNDDIEYIDIECGQNGMPYYINDGEDEAATNRILNHLKRTAGEGNFKFMRNEFDDEFLDEFDDEFLDEFDDEFLDDDELDDNKFDIDIFDALELPQNDFYYYLPNEIQDKINSEGLPSTIEYCLSLINNKDFQSSQLANDIANYILSLDDPQHEDTEYFELGDYLDDITLTKKLPEEYYKEHLKQTSLFSSFDSKSKKVKTLTKSIMPDFNEIENLLDKNPNIPILHYLRITHFDFIYNESKSTFNQTIKKFSEFKIFEIIKYSTTLSDNPKIKSIKELHEKFFGDHRTLNELEVKEIILCYLRILARQGKIFLIPYMEQSFLESKLADYIKNQIGSVFFFVKIQILNQIINDIKSEYPII